MDTTNPIMLMEVAGSKSSIEFTDAARSIIVAIAANRSEDVSAAVGAVVLAAYAENNTQVLILARASMTSPHSAQTT